MSDQKPNHQHPYADAEAPWPLDEGQPDVTLRAVLRNRLADAVVGVARSFDLLPGDEYESEIERQRDWALYFRNFEMFSGVFNLTLALLELQKHDPDAAERMAQWVMAEYDAGDSYGGWLWQWTEKHGLDAQRLIDEAKQCPACNSILPKHPGGVR